MSKLYSEYMKSERWQKVRARRIFKDRGMCFVCGSRHNLEVHHLHYRRLGREKLEDLITLCKTHHRMYHEIQKLSKLSKLAK